MAMVSLHSSSSGLNLQHHHPNVVKIRKKRLLVQAGLPPAPLIAAVRQGWSLAWRSMMEQLAPTNSSSYQRPASQFRGTIVTNPPAASGRYHLYVSKVCPWAHRALIVHSLKGLPSHALPIFFLLPGASGFWEFDQETSPGNGNLRRLMDLYKMDDPGYQGRATVPVLWDSKTRKVVNNESSDIISILNSDFNHLAENPGLDLAPQHLAKKIEYWNQLVYTNVNNGVYRCGFAQGQKSYDPAVMELFATLQLLDDHMSSSRFLCGDSLTLADIRLFTTLVRFDAVYHVLFKCSQAKLCEFSNLYGYFREIYQMPAVASTCNLDVIMDGYYNVLFPLNPGGIKPPVPSTMTSAALYKPHGRSELCKSPETIVAATKSLELT